MSDDTAAFSLPLVAQNLLFREARTANEFLPDPVAPGIVERIYDLVKWGPSSGNTQPLRYLVLASDAAKARLTRHLAQANRAKSAAASLNVILAADTCFHEHMNDLLPYMPNAREYFMSEPARREEAARFNATLQAGYFILGIRASGIAAGPMLGFDKAGVDAEFFPNGRLRSILVINLGKPSATAWKERLPRLSADQTITVL